jgi:hypothetical protein
MLPPVVVIQLEPAPGAAAASVVSERCTAVVTSGGSGGCAFTGDEGARQADWLVRVRWSGASLETAEIVLFHRTELASPIRRRELSFSERSPELDRWESVGLLVAALVVSARAEPETRASPREAPAARPAKLAPARARGGARTRWALGLFAATDLSDFTEWGAGLQGQLVLSRLPVQPLWQLAFSHSSATPTLNTGALSLGIGVPLLEEPLELQLYAQALGQLLRAHARAEGVTESQLVGRLGGSAGLAIYPRLGARWSLWLAAEASLLTPRVTFDVLDQGAGELGYLGFRGFLGLRYSP